MALDLLEFHRRQLFFFEKHVGGDDDFANVVQQGGVRHIVGFLRRHAGGAAHYPDIFRHVNRMVVFRITFDAHQLFQRFQNNRMPLLIPEREIHRRRMGCLRRQRSGGAGLHQPEPLDDARSGNQHDAEKYRRAQIDGDSYQAVHPESGFDKKQGRRQDESHGGIGLPADSQKAQKRRSQMPEAVVFRYQKGQRLIGRKSKQQP